MIFIHFPPPPFVPVFLSHSFPLSSYDSPFNISCSAGLVDVYSFSLFLSGNVLILPFILIESLVGYSRLDCRALFFITWNISCLDWSVCAEKSTASLIGAPLYVTSCFSLAAFIILCL